MLSWKLWPFLYTT